MKWIKWIQEKLGYILTGFLSLILMISGISYLTNRRKLKRLKKNNLDLQKKLLSDQIGKNGEKIRELNSQNEIDDKKYEQLEKERLWLRRRVDEFKETDKLTDEEALEMFRRLRVKLRRNTEIENGH